MSYRLEFLLHGLPKIERNARRRHWAQIHADNDAWKRAVYFATAGRRPKTPIARARVVYTRHSSVAPDPTGLAESFKGVEDGLVEAGILENDRADNYVGGAPTWRWEKAPKGHGHVSITVEEDLTDAEKPDPAAHAL